MDLYSLPKRDLSSYVFPCLFEACSHNEALMKKGFHSSKKLVTATNFILLKWCCYIERRLCLCDVEVVVGKQNIIGCIGLHVDAYGSGRRKKITKHQMIMLLNLLQHNFYKNTDPKDLKDFLWSLTTQT